jgi:2-dehydropantoate 2-reductase
MRIGIVGAGALGTLFGQRLAAGNEVILLERKREVVDAVRTAGLTVDGEARAAYATGEPRELFGVQVLFVFVRATDTLRALRPFTAELSPGTAIVSLQNGLGNEEAIKTSLGGAIPLAIGATTESALTVGPAQVHRVGEGTTVLGSAGASPEVINRVVRLLVDAGFRASAAYDIRPHLWGKLIANAAINPVAALLGRPNGVVLSDVHAGEVARRRPRRSRTRCGSRSRSPTRGRTCAASSSRRRSSTTRCSTTCARGRRPRSTSSTARSSRPAAAPPSRRRTTRRSPRS